MGIVCELDGSEDVEDYCKLDGSGEECALVVGLVQAALMLLPCAIV